MELIKTGYWTYTPSGQPVPGFMHDELTMPSLPPTSRRLLPFALEAEHRLSPITQQVQLDALTQRMLRRSYDWRAAQVLHEKFEAASEVIRDEESAKRSADAERKRKAYGPDPETLLLKAIEEQQLPTGLQANITLAKKLLQPQESRALTNAAFHQLAALPPELEWFANHSNPNTRRSYKISVDDFMQTVGIRQVDEFRIVTRAHVIMWRDKLVESGVNASTVRNRLSALSSLFDYLCEKNALTHNPVTGVKRPTKDTNAGKTPALGDHQARALLDFHKGDDSVKGKRDKAIIATFLYHGLRRDELSKLRVKDIRLQIRGVNHLAVKGKGGKLRFLPLHHTVSELIADYLLSVGHGEDQDAPLFKTLKNNRTGTLDKAMSTDALYKIISAASESIGYKVGPHSMRATAATNALDNGADIAKVQEWLGHADISTTRMYDHRKTRAEDSPTFKVNY